MRFGTFLVALLVFAVACRPGLAGCQVRKGKLDTVHLLNNGFVKARVHNM
jgi:hypothetical protein